MVELVGPVEVEVRQVEVMVVTAGFQGVPGIPGPPGSGLQAVATVNLSGHRAVAYDAGGGIVYAEPGDQVAGVIPGAVMAGGTTNVLDGGILEEPSWTWTVGPVYLGAAGTLTQTEPTTGVWQMVGEAVSATRLAIQIGVAIDLG